MASFLKSGRLNAGLDFDGYIERMREYAARTADEGMSAEDREHLETAAINLHRTERILRTYQPSDGVRHSAERINSPQAWLLLSEVWCGDSAQCVPQIAKIAALSPQISLRIMLRDENPDIMDAYLTDAKRAIPKLVIFGTDRSELARWGPRPKGAQAVFQEALAEGVPKKVRLERLHLWYGRNRGAELDAEMEGLLRSIVEQGID
jgi:hypothetical protein